jgi:hypothetical protein
MHGTMNVKVVLRGVATCYDTYAQLDNSSNVDKL